MKLLLALIAVFALTACAGKRYKHSQDRFHSMWTNMDANSDGEVTKAEFDSAHEKHFKEMDSNSDGKVTMDEKKAFMCSKKRSCGKKKDCGNKSACKKKKACTKKDCKKKDCTGGGCKLE